MTSTSVARKRLAALTLSTALGVGVLAPFIGTSAASATTDCATANSSYSTANAHVIHDKAKVHHFKKKLKKDKRHHKSARTIRKDKHKLHNWKVKLRSDRASRNYWSTQQTNCTTTTTPGGNNGGTSSTNPLSQILQTLTGSGLSPAALTDALNSISSQLRASGAPGAAQLADALDQISAAIASGSSSLDPSQLQTILGQLPSGFDPTSFQNALAAAAAAMQQSLATPPTSAQGLIDAIFNPLIAGFGSVSAANPLTGALISLRDTLDSLLAGLPGLGSLPGLPGSGGTPIPGVPSLPIPGLPLP